MKQRIVCEENNWKKWQRKNQMNSLNFYDLGSLRTKGG
jgi:hypothetical protein